MAVTERLGRLGGIGLDEEGVGVWQIERAKVVSLRGALIKVADKTSNVRSTLNPATAPDWPPERRQAYVEWAVTVVGSLTNPPESALVEFYGPVKG